MWRPPRSLTLAVRQLQAFCDRILDSDGVTDALTTTDGGGQRRWGRRCLDHPVTGELSTPGTIVNFTAVAQLMT